MTLRDRALHHVALLVAAAAWLCGYVLVVAGRPVFEAAPWWLVFLVGTICAERLELNRLLPRTAWTVRPSPPRSRSWSPARRLGRGGGAGHAAHRRRRARPVCLALAKRRRPPHRAPARRRALHRGRLLSGYGWLGAGGTLALWLGNPLAGPSYDALLHATFVGFVFSMIFGHALVIVPSVLGVRVDFRGRFYAHLLLLHAAVATRLAGDLLDAPAARRLGGWLNAAAILLFIVSTVWSVRQTRAGLTEVKDRSLAGAR